MNQKALKINDQGIMLLEDESGRLSITKESIGPKCNLVFHVGKRDYVKRRWNKGYACRTEMQGPFRIRILENSLKFYG